MAASNASGTTHTTMTLLDDRSSSIGGESFQYSNHNGSIGCSASLSSTNTSSMNESINSNSEETHSMTPTDMSIDNEVHKIYNYKVRDFVEHKHLSTTTCEDVCLGFCRALNIAPTTRYLFGLRVYKSDTEWAVPGRPLKVGERYSFRIRFKVPSLDTQLLRLDPNAYEYLYNQMRYDMVNENIPEIRYPAKKDEVVGLGVLDMCIDLSEQVDTAEHIEANYKRYLPRRLLRAHKWWVKSKMRGKFQELRSKNINLALVKLNYVRGLHALAPNYLLETFVGIVNYIPGEEQTEIDLANGANITHAQVYVKIDQYDSAEPGLKIARIAPENKLQWVLLAKFEDINAVCVMNNKCVRLEIVDFPKEYEIVFDTSVIDSFVTYLSGYVRLTTSWIVDLCTSYSTPSLKALLAIRCHGPIGAAFSFATIREKSNECGSYIIRQCEREYDTYYIDIKTKRNAMETFKITKDSQNNTKWLLHLNNNIISHNSLDELVHSIPTESERKLRMKPSPYDKPPLLLICLPKNVQRKQTDTKLLSKADLKHKRPQIFFPGADLEWYKNTEIECDNGKMCKIRGDWVQHGQFQEIPVTLKVLKHETDFGDFTKLARTWSQVDSPHCIKFYGITLYTPYTMVLEYPMYGPLDELLQRHQKRVSVLSLLDVVHGLISAIVYLNKLGITHGYIRCSNLHVTKFDIKSDLLTAKLADPGFPRPYGKEDLPWIPIDYYDSLNDAKNDKFTDYWAFATTIWEIFARGQKISHLSVDTLRLNYNRYGAILLKPHDCPHNMYDIMTNGWSENDGVFTPQSIFSTLVETRESERKARWQNHWSENVNGNSANGTLHSSSNSSINSTTCDEFPLMQNEQHNGRDRPMVGMRARDTYFDITNSVRQLRNGKVVYKKEIGGGHYGTVYLGELCLNSPNVERELVAIKTLKSLSLSEDFVREIQIMQELDHKNIVKIKQWIDNPISIIMEYIEGGSFQIYLVSRKPNLANETLLRFAVDIANGMDYLRSKNIIHRDLAARNILVDRDSVKISDFGLAQVANSDGYYVSKSVREMPIKWYSPESIRTEKFSFQSDVWSYGVTLFEMFSRGEIPNLDPGKDMKQDDFLNRLERGERLYKPEMCPQIVYDNLMMPCWDANPKQRPTFKEIIDIIQSIRNQNCENI